MKSQGTHKSPISKPVDIAEGCTRTFYPQQKEVKSDVCRCSGFKTNEQQGDEVPTIYLPCVLEGWTFLMQYKYLFLHKK